MHARLISSQDCTDGIEIDDIRLGYATFCMDISERGNEALHSAEVRLGAMEFDASVAHHR